MTSENQFTAKLDSILELTPIPAWTGVHDWPPIEAELGFALPAEYKAYAQRFPSGSHGRLDVFHPDGYRGFTLVKQVRKYANMFTGFRLGRQFYPEPGGLVPWGQFETETCLFWLPETDSPDEWPVVACSSTGKYEAIPGTTLEALAAVLRGDAGRTAFPPALWDDSLEFLPRDVRVSAEFGLISWDEIPPDYNPPDYDDELLR